MNMFTQTDPLEASVGQPYPSSYVYGNNNPLVYVDPSGLQSNLGQNVVNRNRQMIMSTATKYGLLPDLPAAILLGENDFGVVTGRLSEDLEQYTPERIQGDRRTGVANLHSWDTNLIEGAGEGPDRIARHFSQATIDNEIALVDPALKGKSLKELLVLSGRNEKLNVKLLILTMVGTSKEFAGMRQGKPGLSPDKALLLARKTGLVQAGLLLQGKYEDYNLDIAQNYCDQYDFDCRKKLLVPLLDGATEPKWLKQYGPYRATARKLLRK
jgi:hypothetical protein